MLILKLPSLALFAALLIGCASPAQVQNMRVNAPIELPQDSALHRQLSINEITGGQATNPLWISQVSNNDFRQALESSLRSAGLLSEGSTARYRLNAHLDSLRQPFVAASATVHAKVHYVIRDIQTEEVVFEKTIDLPYTAAFSDAFAGVKRLRLANEGAIRVNIQALLNDLATLDISHVEL